jgi:hypothetical protein
MNFFFSLFYLSVDVPSADPIFFSPLCLYCLIFLCCFSQLPLLTLSTFPPFLVIKFSIPFFAVTRISSPHFQHYSCFKSLTHSPFQPDTLHKSTYSPCPITVKRARIICLMRMHPGSGPGTSSRKCSMTPIYFA